MTVRPEPTIAPADLLRLNACPACNYSLRGLGETGICPECGSAFDRAVVVLHGYARGTRAHIGNARPWVAVWMLLWPLINLILNPGFWSAKLFIFGGAAALVVLMFAWRRRTDAPGLVQVELSAAGCRQFDMDKRERELRTPPTPWDQIDKIEIGRTVSSRPSVRIMLTASSSGGSSARQPSTRRLLAATSWRTHCGSVRRRGKGVAALDHHPAGPTGGFPVIMKPPPPAG